MAKKADLLNEAKELGLKVSAKNTIAEIEKLIKLTPKSTSEAKKGNKDNQLAPLAKAGKRSAKALAKAEEKAEKEVRKQTGDTAPQSSGTETKVKKGLKPIVRPKSERHGKKYRALAKLIENGKIYSLNEALELAIKTSPVKFDASVEVHLRLGIDVRQADQNIRATISLPNGTGKNIRVAVFAPEAEHISAKKAGADVARDEDFLQQLDKESLDFDILITTPQYMPRLSKYARLLGPRGLMPNPKSGTVATNITKAVSEAKTGKVEYRVDKQAIVHLAIGKVSFGTEKLLENAKLFFDSLQNQKPTSLKSAFIKTTTISTTQGPGIKVDTNLS